MVWMWNLSSVAEAVENARYAEEHMNLTEGTRLTFLHRPGFVGKPLRTFPRGGGSRPPPYGNRVMPRIVATGISMAASAEYLVHRQRCKQVHNHLREQRVGSRVLGEGTHFRDSHITMHRFNLVLPVGGAEDPITSVTAQSYNQGSCIEKERHRWGEQVAATRFTQR
jgi:hypothetical protein